MRISSRRPPFRHVVPLLALLLAACDNPVEDHEEHPVGLIVFNAQSQQVASSTGRTVTGSITVPRTGPTTLTVAVVGEDGDRIAIGGELELRAAVTGGVATAAIQNRNQVVITPVQTGSGSLQLTLLHGGHEEFNPLFPLTVAP